MRPEILKVNLVQLDNLAHYLSGATYTDEKKTEYRDTLLNWNEAIQNKATIPMNDVEHGKLMQDMELLFTWMGEFVHSEQNQLPIELDRIINHLCTDWISTFDKFVIGISNGPFCVMQPNNNMTTLLDRIRLEYPGVVFKRQLITIRLPKHLKDDLFNTVSILHEVGHFFAKEEKLPKLVWERIKKLFPSDPKLAQIIPNNFPWWVQGVQPTEQMIMDHIDEYIADLFGAQYVGTHILNYLDYAKAHCPDTIDSEHPSYNCRKTMVEAFVNDDKTNGLLNIIKEEFVTVGKELSYKRAILSDASFLNSKPMPISNDKELFSTFGLAWDILLRGRTCMEAVIGTSISERDFYNNLNTSLRETIKEYYKL